MIEMYTNRSSITLGVTRSIISALVYLTHMNARAFNKAARGYFQEVWMICLYLCNIVTKNINIVYATLLTVV